MNIDFTELYNESGVEKLSMTYQFEELKVPEGLGFLIDGETLYNGEADVEIEVPATVDYEAYGSTYVPRRGGAEWYITEIRVQDENGTCHTLALTAKDRALRALYDGHGDNIDYEVIHLEH